MNPVVHIFSFKKVSRLQHRHEFDAVFRHGHKITSGFLTILLKPNDLGMSRLGMIVAKRYIAAATKRNRLKRLIREAFRQMKAQLGPCDLIVLVNKAEIRHNEMMWSDTVSQALKKTICVVPGLTSI